MMKRVIPWTVFAVFVAFVAASAPGWRAASHEGFDLAGFGRLPVGFSGRVRPMDSVARMGLLQVRGTVDVPLGRGDSRWPIGGTRLSATEWLLEVLVKPDVADTRRIFPIADATLLSKLQLKPAPDAAGYFTFKEIAPRNGQISTEATRISKILPAKQAPWERQLVALRFRLASYERLKNSLQANSLLQGDAKGAPVQYNFTQLLTAYRANLAETARVAAQRQRGNKNASLDPAKAAEMMAFVRPFTAVSKLSVIATIPSPRPGDSRDGWMNIGAVIVASARTAKLPAPVTQLAAISSEFASGNPATFNRLVDGYQGWLASNAMGPALRRARYEFFYNLLQPYAKAVALYLVAVIFLCAGWKGRSAMLYRSGVLVAALAIALHSTGLLLDMMLSGRLPVFSGLALMALCSWTIAVGTFVFERSSGRRVLAVGAAVASLTLVTAHALSAAGLTLLVTEVASVPFAIAVALALALVVLPLARERAVRAPAAEAAPVPA
jgi:hypothetical protein